MLSVKPFNAITMIFRKFSNQFLLSVCLVLFCAFILSCKPSAPAAEAGSGDLAGFELSALSNGTQYAIRKDGNGQIVFEGYVDGNKKTGQWLEYNAEGEIVNIENYVNGLREGVALKMTNRGQVDLRARYHEGVLHGPWTQFKFGKIIEERSYTTGKLDGTVKTYDDRTWKVKQEVQYKNGVQDGFFRYYDEEGVVTLEYEYKNGEKISGGIVKK